MPRYQWTRPARAALLDQLIAAGFAPTTLVEMDDARCWVTCDPADYDRAVAVVAAHDAAALDAAAAQAASDDAGDRAAARQAVAALVADRAALLDTTQALTTAQLRAALARTDGALLALIRHFARQGGV